MYQWLKSNMAILVSVILLLGITMTVSAKPVEITYVTWDGPERHIPYYNALRSIEKKFNEEHPDIKANYLWIGDEYPTKIATMTLAGNPPDVIYHDEFQAAHFLYQDWIEDLTPYIERDPASVDGIYPSLLEAMNAHGIQYSIGSSHLPMVLHFRKDMFREAGLDRPDKGWTWDEFLTYSQKLTQRDSQGTNTQWGFQIQHCAWGGLGAFGAHAWGISNGINPIDAATKEVNLGSPEFVEVLQFMTDLMYKYEVCTSPGLQLPGQIGQPYQTGTVAMVYNGAWMLGDPGYEGVEWGATYLPVNKGVTPLGSNVCGWFINKNSRNKKEAWEFVKALTHPYGQTLQARDGMFPSVRHDINEKHSFTQPNLDAADRDVFFDTMVNLNFIPGDMWRIPNMNKIQDEYIKIEMLILNGEKKPEDIKEIVPIIEDLMK